MQSHQHIQRIETAQTSLPALVTSTCLLTLILLKTIHMQLHLSGRVLKTIYMQLHIPSPAFYTEKQIVEYFRFQMETKTFSIIQCKNYYMCNAYMRYTCTYKRVLNVIWITLKHTICLLEVNDLLYIKTFHFKEIENKQVLSFSFNLTSIQ